MGGFGSGERYSKKATVEGRYAIDLALMRRWKLLIPGTANRPGAFQWGGDGDKADASVAYLLTVGPDTGALRLLYTVRSADTNLDYVVRLVTTPCHLGGVRWWFVCPLSRDGVPCGRRARKLYLSGRYFGCRACHGLTYRSTQESDARVYALARDGVGSLGDPRLLSVGQLGLALKAIELMRKRLHRIDV